LSRISCIIITHNESGNIRRCLEGVGWTDEIILIDSFSTDDTKKIASEFTDRIFDLKWEGFGRAKEFARSRASGEWILSVDADEVVSEKLRDEIQKTAALDDPLDGYFLPRRSNFLGRWIMGGGWYPDWVLRLFKKSKGNFTDRLVHEEVRVSGKTGYLTNDLLHYSLSEEVEPLHFTGCPPASQRGEKGEVVGHCPKTTGHLCQDVSFQEGILGRRSGTDPGGLLSVPCLLQVCKTLASETI
jgi:glycosyltransferase involved in cell wall biosynthesis